MKKHASIEDILIETPGILDYSREYDIEIMPKVYSPIFLSVKKIVSLPKERKQIVNFLLECTKKIKFDYICGIESGGTFFASSLATLTNKPLIFLRKAEKIYGDKKRIVGDMPRINSTVLLVDDVLATGSTLQKAKQYFDLIGCQSAGLLVFSYGYEKEIGDKLKMKITAASSFRKLAKICLNKKIFTPDDVLFLEKHIQKYKDFI